MKSNNPDLRYVTRFWHKKQKRFISASFIDFNKKRIGEFNTSNFFLFTSTGLLEWVRPTFVFDSNKQMIYQHDIVTADEGEFEVVWSPEDNCFSLISKTGDSFLFLDDSKDVTVIGNAYEKE